MSDRPRVLVIAGPTAAGKTAVSLAVAEAFGATVLSADAMQVYRGFDIGTAKATPEDRARVPHAGVDVRDATETFDAADFRALAWRLFEAGERVVVAGGTHLYVHALIRGLASTPPVDPSLRASLEALADPHAELARVDPVLAARLHPNDRVRVVRGLEVFHATGERLSALQRAHAASPDEVDATILWLDRDDLRERIAARLGAMLDAGYVEEVRGLLARGVPRDCKPMRSLGYRHLADAIVGDIDRDEAIRRTERDTWALARKQRNWRRKLRAEVVPGGPEAVARALHAAARVWPG